MKVFKIAAERYASKLSASGRPNRWNRKGEFVIYTGSSRSLSSLELIVHRSSIKPTITYRVMILSLPDDPRFYKTIYSQDLAENWQSLYAYTDLQNLGSQWYQNKQSLILKVPSAVIPLEFNYLLNTKHPEFEKCIQLVRTEAYFWDERLPL